MLTSLSLNNLRIMRGFTLVELMIVMVILAIIASIAIPGYQNYIKSSHARAAAGDLVGLGLVMENMYQRQLRYPYSATTGLPNNLSLPTTSTNDTIRYANGVEGAAALPASSLWQPAEKDNFEYTLAVPASGNKKGRAYTLTATGRSGTLNAGCILSLNSANVRTINGNSGCGGIASW